ncbi:hypothetical protein [Syntrophothermus lipocalidus]|uniref:Uncharacterized protein n=1 Tax=Syntrophothermus lipocalidus (strain DSM 12680 / TGB-C1) TaxID=643648 RepID=D7CPU4_SYNLT|nr:hypothetical protein [Syntrophothermus lipocalidus]ADI02722.1 hypothetical protein Slip_1971 [Syntrophothermus lipocalidus DSM 12680]
MNISATVDYYSSSSIERFRYLSGSPLDGAVPRKPTTKAELISNVVGLISQVLPNWGPEVAASTEARVNKMIEEMVRLGVKIANAEDFREYLLSHPGIIEYLAGAVRETCRRFPRPENRVTVAVERDYEDPDFKYIVINLLTDMYGEPLVEIIDAIESKYLPPPGEEGQFFILPQFERR